MTTKHTPGKWVFEPAQKAFGIRVSCNGKDICQMSSYPFDQEEAEANARLIAAAPELLEACKALLEHGGCTEPTAFGVDMPTERWEDAIIKAKKAIAKAGGTGI